MFAPVTVTAAATAVSGDAVLVNAAGGTITITLDSSSDAGEAVVVKKIDSSGNAVTVATEGAGKIDGADTKVLSSQYDSMMAVYNGTHWYLV